MPKIFSFKENLKLYILFVKLEANAAQLFALNFMKNYGCQISRIDRSLPDSAKF